MCKAFILLILVYRCAGSVFKPNALDYGRMPSLLSIDPFDSCLQQPGDLYCMVDFTLVSDDDSELLTVIKKYSENTSTRFNHSNLRRGLCVNESCRNFHAAGTSDTKLQLEACLNRTFEVKYNLRTLVTRFSCDEYGAKREEIDYADICVGVVIFALVFLAIVGSFIDILFTKPYDKGYSMFVNFSLIHNWKRLIAPYEEVTDPRRRLFKFLHGIRAFMVCLVIIGHSREPYTMAMKNIHLIEEHYNFLPQYVFLNGNMVVQIYFVISGMLLIYKLEIYAENNKIGYDLLPKAIVQKWIRLTPAYAMATLVIATWIRFLKFGPFWEVSVGQEINDCREHGWLGLVYLNNYAFNTQCLPHTWHLAADMQLYCCGFFIYFLATNTNRKKLILTLAFVISLLIPAAVTYVLDLDALIIVSPRNLQTFFATDPTYNAVYKKGYTNLPCYVIGLMLGYLIYYLQGSNFQVDKYKKYRIVYWLLVPACCIPILLGSIFYHEPRSILLRVLFATFAKPFFGLLVAILVLGMVFKYETVYRGLFEWRGWLPLSRLSYCAFIVHLIIARLYTSSKTELTEVSSSTTLFMLVLFIVGSFAVAVPLWFLVEAPITGLLNFYNMKQMSSSRTNGLSENKKSMKEKTI